MSKDVSFPVEEDSLEYDRRLFRNRDTFDSQKLIRDVLATASEDGPVCDPSCGISFRKLSSMNVDVQTRIIMRMALQATSGDVRSAEFLFKYAGLEPPKEQTLTVQTPTFIDDIDFEVVEEEDEEDEDEDDIPALPSGETEDAGAPVLIEPTEQP